MSNLYTLKESTLTALADIAREQTIGSAESLYLYEENITLKPMDKTYYEIPEVKKLKVIITPIVFGDNGNGMKTCSLGLKQGKPNSWNDYEIVIKGDNPNNLPYETIIEGSIVGVYGVSGPANNSIKINIELFGLDENGNEYKYTPLEAIEIIDNTIANLKTTSIPEAALKITGDCSYRFAYNGWNWFIDLYGDKITTENVVPTNMFLKNTINTIPFEINGYKVGTCSLAGMFQECSNLKEVPKINNIKPSNLSNMFNSCYRLEYIPDDYFDSFDFTEIKNEPGSYGKGNMSYMFSYCEALRKIPSSFLKQENINRYISSSYSLYYSCFQRCSSLDELVNIPVHDKGDWASNAFYYFTTQGGRLKRITFCTNEDGSPIVCDKWKNQTIDLTKAGYITSGNFYNYSTSITENDQVKDDATYQALKDSPNWWTRLLAYSRYNHISAVETINSLPDVSSGSGNTIKFGRNAGLNTDEGPCGNLTEEEIAVATARGWTVSFG